jgi:hypothetical protein
VKELPDEVLEVHPPDASFPSDLLERRFAPPQADSSTSGPFFITPPEEIARVLKKGVSLTDAEMERIITHSHNQTWTQIGRVL